MTNEQSWILEEIGTLSLLLAVMLNWSIFSAYLKSLNWSILFHHNETLDSRHSLWAEYAMLKVTIIVSMLFTRTFSCEKNFTICGIESCKTWKETYKRLITWYIIVKISNTKTLGIYYNCATNIHNNI